MNMINNTPAGYFEALAANDSATLFDMITVQLAEDDLSDSDRKHLEEVRIELFVELNLVPTYSVSYKEMKHNALEAGWAAHASGMQSFKSRLNRIINQFPVRINNMTKSIARSTI